MKSLKAFFLLFPFVLLMAWYGMLSLTTEFMPEGAAYFTVSVLHLGLFIMYAFAVHDAYQLLMEINELKERG